MRLVSYSEVSTFRACPLKWHLGYQVGLKGPERKPKLDLGTAWHLVQQNRCQFEKDHPELDPQERQEAGYEKARWTIANIRDLLPGQVYEVEPEERLGWMLDGYFERWAEEDLHFDILETEFHWFAPLGIRSGNETVKAHGFIDVIRLDRRTGRVRPSDYKSASGRNLAEQTWARELRLDDQFGVYDHILREFYGFDVAYFWYDGARTDKLKREMTLEERFNRVALKRSPGELAVLWEEFRVAVKEMLATERGARPITSNPEVSVCRWKCDFMDAHLMGRMNGGDYVAAAKGYGFETREERRARHESPEPSLLEAVLAQNDRKLAVVR